MHGGRGLNIRCSCPPNPGPRTGRHIVRPLDQMDGTGLPGSGRAHNVETRLPANELLQVSSFVHSYFPMSPGTYVSLVVGFINGATRPISARIIDVLWGQAFLGGYRTSSGSAALWKTAGRRFRGDEVTKNSISEGFIKKFFIGGLGPLYSILSWRICFRV